MIEFDREDHNLKEEDIFFVIGGYEGNISDRIIKKYNPNVFIFEPSKKWFDFLSEKYKNNNKVKIYNFGFSSKEGEYKLFKHGVGDGSNIYTESDEYEIVKLKPLSDFIKEHNFKVKMVEINCEGCEYEIIKDIYENNQINNIEIIQVQFHQIINHQNLILETRDILLKTHNLKWSYGYIFECYQLK